MAIELRTEHIFDAHFDLAPPAEFIVFGKGGKGIRCMVPVKGGSIEGPKIKATLRFGADWALIRDDSAFIADVRMVLETDDGALIHMEYDGILAMSEAETEKALQGEFPPVAWAHTTLWFETGYENYLWLNKIRAAAIGKLVSEKGDLYVDYSVYALV